MHSDVDGAEESFRREEREGNIREEASFNTATRFLRECPRERPYFCHMCVEAACVGFLGFDGRERVVCSKIPREIAHKTR